MYDVRKRQRGNLFLKSLYVVLPLCAVGFITFMFWFHADFMSQKEPVAYTMHDLLQNPPSKSVYAELLDPCFLDWEYYQEKNHSRTYYYLLVDCADSMATTSSIVLQSDRSLGDEVWHTAITGKLSRQGLEYDMKRYISRKDLLQEDYLVLLMNHTPAEERRITIIVSSVAVLFMLGGMLGVYLTLKQRRKFDEAVARYRAIGNDTNPGNNPA